MKYKFLLKNYIKDKLFIVRLASFLAFLIPFVTIPKIWLSDRLFPLVPYFEQLPVPNLVGDVVLIAIFFLAYVFFVFRPNWKYGLPVVIIYIFWALLDQNRLQPFYFEIILVVFALTEFKDSPRRVRQCILLILIATYFWSGLHKINTLFFEFWAKGLEKRIPFVPLILREIFTYAVPFLECSFGVLLVFPRTRKWGIWLIACMHAMILTTFIVGNFGYLVFPLTLFNVFVLFYLFYREPLSLKHVFDLKRLKTIIIFIAVVILPFFNFMGYYDHILSFSYFSAKPKYCRLYFKNTKDTERLPSHIKINVRMFEKNYYIDFNEWSARTIGVMVYPEKRVYKALQEDINKYLMNSDTYLEYY